MSVMQVHDHNAYNGVATPAEARYLRYKKELHQQLIASMDLSAIGTLSEEELRRFQEWRYSLAASPTIAALREHAEAIRRAEVDRTLARMREVTPEDRERIDALTRAIVKKLLHTPFARIKDPDGNELWI